MEGYDYETDTQDKGQAKKEWVEILPEVFIVIFYGGGFLYGLFGFIIPAVIRWLRSL